MRYEIRQVDALLYDDGWTYNETWFMGHMVTSAKDEGKAFRHYLEHCGVRFYPYKTMVQFNGDIYEIVNRSTGEPLFCAIPEGD